MIYSPISSPIRSAVSSLFANRGGFVPSRLFASGEQGAWYDPSDWSTLYQDSAGTTPVTAVEQPVGRILDKSGRGNHATQTTSTSRPVLSARYNLLTKTEQVEDAVWTKSEVIATANAAVAPDGTMTADKLSANAVNALHRAFNGASLASGTRYVFSIYVKRAEYTTAVVFTGASGGGGLSERQILVDLSSGAILSETVAGSGSVLDVGDGWYKVSVTTAQTTGSGSPGFGVLPNIGTAFTGDGTSGVYIWGASLVPANQASIPYQRVNTATDYDADPAKFKPYLRFDGVDDFLVTNSIDFTSTDKMTVFAGVRKLSDAAVGMVAELSASSTANNGAFALFAPNAASTYALRSKGTTDALITSAASYTSPITNVLAGIGDISGDSAILRINGAQVAQSTTDQGTGNFGNYPLYIGRRGGTTFPYNGQLYSLIVRGAATSGTQVSQTETWVNQRTGAY